MAVVTVYTAVALFVQFFFVTTAAIEDSFVPVYDSFSEPGMEEKRFPDHFNNQPPSWFWFNVGECPETKDGIKQFYCASVTPDGRTVCIDDHQLCNGVKECPNAEDENPKYCLFYNVLKSSVRGLERDVQNLLRRNVDQSKPQRYNHGITHRDYH